MLNLKKMIAGLFAVLLVASCTSTGTPPTSLVSSVESEIALAEEAGADSDAPVAIRNAKTRLEKARGYMQNEEYEEARFALEKASVDARYALVLSNSKKSKESAQVVEESLETLNEEI